MVGKFIPHCHADAPRLAGYVDDVDAGDLRLLAAVLSVCRHLEWLSVRTQNLSTAFVEPFRRNPNRALDRPPALSSPLVHLHAVGWSCIGSMHRLPVLCALNVRQPGAAYQAFPRLSRVIAGRENAPVRSTHVDVVIGQIMAGSTLLHRGNQVGARSQSVLCELVHGLGSVRKDDSLIVDHPDAALALAIANLQQSHRRASATDEKSFPSQPRCRASRNSCCAAFPVRNSTLCSAASLPAYCRSFCINSSAKLTS